MSAYKIIISKIIPMHMMKREITLGRKRGFNGVLYNL